MKNGTINILNFEIFNTKLIFNYLCLIFTKAQIF